MAYKPTCVCWEMAGREYVLEGAAPDNEADSLEEQRLIYNPYFPSTYVHRSGHANTDPAQYADDEDFQRNNPCRRLTMTIVQHRKQIDRLIMRFGERELFDFMEGVGLGFVVKEFQGAAITDTFVVDEGLEWSQAALAQYLLTVPELVMRKRVWNRGRMLATPLDIDWGQYRYEVMREVSRAIEQFNERYGEELELPYIDDPGATSAAKIGAGGYSFVDTQIGP